MKKKEKFNQSKARKKIKQKHGKNTKIKKKINNKLSRINSPTKSQIDL